MTTADLPSDLDRLADARAAYAALADRVAAGEPWPLAEHFGTEPEANLVAFCSDIGISPTRSATMLSVMLASAFIARQALGRVG